MSAISSRNIRISSAVLSVALLLCGPRPGVARADDSPSGRLLAQLRHALVLGARPDDASQGAAPAPVGAAAASPRLPPSSRATHAPAPRGAEPSAPPAGARGSETTGPPPEGAAVAAGPTLDAPLYPGGAAARARTDGKDPFTRIARQQPACSCGSPARAGPPEGRQFPGVRSGGCACPPPRRGPRARATGPSAAFAIGAPAIALGAASADSTSGTSGSGVTAAPALAPARSDGGVADPPAPGRSGGGSSTPPPGSSGGGVDDPPPPPRLVERDLFATGDRLLTQDTGSGLLWLDVTASLGQPYGSVAEGVFVRELGFRFATQQEVESVLATAGVLGTPASTGERFAAASDLVARLGCTDGCGDAGTAKLMALYDLVPAHRLFAGSAEIGVLNGMAHISLTAGNVFKDSVYASAGHFLVADVGAALPPLTAAPLPPAWLLFPAALGALAALRRRCRV